MLVCALTAFVASANGTEQKKGGAKKAAKTTAVTKTKKNTAKKAATTAAKGNGSFIVISKKDLNLRVYSKDSTLLAEYPCCLSKNKGNKQKKGDMKTPESPAGKPFKITAIQDASTPTIPYLDQIMSEIQLIQRSGFNSQYQYNKVLNMLY